MNNYGPLYLIPTLLGDISPLEVLPISIKRIVEQVDDYIVENEKTARRFIKLIAPKKSQSVLNLNVLNKYTLTEEHNDFLNACLSGKPMGLISDAGCPAIADPGAVIVKMAHHLNIKVTPMVGPSSIILALMASGLNGQNFSFNGYLPIDKTQRKLKIKAMEKQSYQNKEAQICIETPYRNNSLLEALSTILHPSSELCIACDLTLPTEFIATKPAKLWIKNKVDLNKRPAIFIWQKF